MLSTLEFIIERVWCRGPQHATALSSRAYQFATPTCVKLQQLKTLVGIELKLIGQSWEIKAQKFFHEVPLSNEIDQHYTDEEQIHALH